MNNTNKDPFSSEYIADVSSTESTLQKEERKEEDTSELKIESTKYGTGKPFRTIIKAKITHDKG